MAQGLTDHEELDICSADLELVSIHRPNTSIAGDSIGPNCIQMKMVAAYVCIICTKTSPEPKLLVHSTSQFCDMTPRLVCGGAVGLRRLSYCDFVYITRRLRVLATETKTVMISPSANNDERIPEMLCGHNAQVHSPPLDRSRKAFFAYCYKTMPAQLKQNV